MSEQRWHIVFLMPVILVFGVLTLAPVINLIAVSFYEVKWSQGAAIHNWVGLANWSRIPQDNLLGAGVWNTAVFMFFAVALQMILGFGLAYATVNISRGRLLYQAVFLIPILVPAIVIGAVWKLMYDYDFGVINQLFGVAGLPPQGWLSNSSLALGSVIAVDVWHWTPFVYLLMLAGLESMPRDVLEAASLDGASGFDQLLYVVLPIMMPTILVTLAFRAIIAFKVFDEIFLLTSGGPGTATEVISFTIFRRFFSEDQAGYGSALSVAALIVLMLLLGLGLYMTRRLSRS